ncbi:hypothetical protein [Enterococcus bulliens]
MDELYSVVDYLERLNYTGEDSIKNEFFGKYAYSEEYLKDLEKNLEKIETGNFATSKEKGDFLEKIATSIFCYKNLFEVKNNIHTSTNEVDLMIIATPKTQLLTKIYYNELTDLKIIGECKNYNKKVDVTWIGKVYSLVKLHNYNMCVLFSRKGFTGNKWTYGEGLVRKIALKDNLFILDINLNDLKQLNNQTIFDLLNAKLMSIKYDIDYQKLIDTHPGEKIRLEAVKESFFISEE